MPTSAATTRSRCASGSSGSSARRAAAADRAPVRAGIATARGVSTRRPPAPRRACSPTRWCVGAGGAAAPTPRRCSAPRRFILHPEIAAERLETLAELPFRRRRRRPPWRRPLPRSLAESPEIEPRRAARRAGTRGARGGESRRCSGKLREFRPRRAVGRRTRSGPRRSGTTLPTCVCGRGALSIERQAAATALGRETSDVHLSRLRDIQEQDQRSLRPD